MRTNPERERILVTGGAGFIGGHLSRALVASGRDVTVVDDLRVPPMIPPDGTAKFLEKPVLELEEADLADVEIVYHLASHKSVPRSFKQPLDYLDNVDSGRHLLSLCANTGVSRVLVGSTCEVYGVAGVLPTPEAAPLSPRSPYAASKVALEMLARAYQTASAIDGPEVGIVRFFNVYGPGERPDALIPRLCANVLSGRAMPIEGGGEQRRDFTYIDDVVRKLAALAEKPVVPVINLGTGESISVNDIVEVLLDLVADAQVTRKAGRPNEIGEFLADISLQTELLGRAADRIDIAEGTRLTLEWWESRDVADTRQHLLREESS
jgi:nucleoside-diphosphate-sugar epimerase